MLGRTAATQTRAERASPALTGRTGLGPALDWQCQPPGCGPAEQVEAARGLCVGTQWARSKPPPCPGPGCSLTAQPSLPGFLSCSPAPASRSLLKPHSHHTRSLGHWLRVSGENVHHGSLPHCSLLVGCWPCFLSPLKQRGDGCTRFLHHPCQPPASPPGHPAWLLEA